MIEAGGVGEPAPPASSWARSRPIVAIWAVALLAMLPELIGGPSFSFSFRYNFAWAGEFSRLFLGGNPWPRWLPALWDGLGSPSFYFYPPLYFWVVSLVRAASLGALPVVMATSVATLVILATSGLAMRAWLRGMASEKAALIGAIGYMLAPYHLDDIYTRGALAEVTTYALLPLIMVALRRLAASGKAQDMAWLALGYAMLVLSHLPIALLASVTLLPLTMLWRVWHGAGFRFLFRCALAFAVGGGLAASYWLPALALRPYVFWQAMGGDFYRIDRWFFFTETWWQVSFPIFLTLAACLFALAALMKSRSGEVPLWVCLILLSALLISGALPFVWKLPGLREVQFAWRLLTVVEFAVITLLVLAPPRIMHPLTIGGITALFAAFGIMFSTATHRLTIGWQLGEVEQANLLARMTDAPEYLPAGYPISNDEWGRADGSKFVPPRLPLAQAAGAESLEAASTPDGGMVVRTKSNAPVRVVARRFFFPGWVASDGQSIVPTVSCGRDRLVSWIAPAGTHEFRLYRERPAAEVAGLIISALSAAVLMMLALYGRKRKVAGARLA